MLSARASCGRPPHPPCEKMVQNCGTIILRRPAAFRPGPGHDILCPGNSGFEGQGLMMLYHLQAGLGLAVIVAAAWPMSENRRAFPCARCWRGWRCSSAGASAAQGAAGARRAAVAQRGGRCADAGDQGRHLLRLRLCRRRGGALRGHRAAESDQLRLQRAAAGDRDFGAGGAAVVLARPAGDRERLCLCAAARPWASAARWVWARRPPCSSA